MIIYEVFAFSSEYQRSTNLLRGVHLLRCVHIFMLSIVSDWIVVIVGFTTRLEAEIENMAMKVHKTKITCNIDAPNNRKYLPFIGASRYKTLPGFEDNCFFLNDYLEYGPSLFQL